jgi:hypothetical protein
MKKTYLLLLASLFGITSQGYSQRNTTLPFTERIAKEWKLQYYGDNDKKQPPSKQQLEDRMTFYKDNRVLSVEQGKRAQGVWQYDSSKKLLTITDNQTREKQELQILQLDNEQFVVGYKDPAGTLIEIHMLAVRQ